MQSKLTTVTSIPFGSLEALAEVLTTRRHLAVIRTGSFKFMCVSLGVHNILKIIAKLNSKGFLGHLRIPWTLLQFDHRLISSKLYIINSKLFISDSFEKSLKSGFWFQIFNEAFVTETVISISLKISTTTFSEKRPKWVSETQIQIRLLNLSFGW